MEVTSTSLTGPRNQDIPKQVSQTQTQVIGKFGEKVRKDLGNMGGIKRDTQVIQAKRIDPVVSQTPEYTRDAIKTALEKARLALQAGFKKDPTDATTTPTPSVGGGGGGGGSNVNKGYFSADDLSGMSTQELVDRDNKMYGNTFPEGSFSATDTLSMVRRDNLRYGDTFPEGSFSITKEKEKGGQGGLPLGTTTLRDGEKQEGPAVNASGFQQKNVRGSTSFDGTGKDESARPKQTVAALPSNYKSTEKEAFDKAKSWQDSKEKGKAATQATGIPSGTDLKAGSFGISEAGKKEAEANKKAAEEKKAAEAKAAADAKAKADAKAAADKKAKQAEAKKKAEAAKKQQSTTKSSGRKSNTGSKKSSRGGKSGGGSKGGSKSGGSKGTSGSKKSSRGAKGGGSSKGGTSKGGARTNRKRSRRRCDIRCKFDISLLTNQNLIRDDLADVAYFVKDLQEIN